MVGSRSDYIAVLLDRIAEELASISGHGTSRTYALENKICAWCEADCSKDDSFRDSASKREYLISALCQKCQDDFFR